MDDGRNYLFDVTNCDYGSVGYPDLLFMAHGPSGSYDTSYTFVLDDGYYEDSITYTYDLDENHYYDADDLVISNQKYVSPGAMTAVPAPVAAADLTYNGLSKRVLQRGRATRCRELP